MSSRQERGQGGVTIRRRGRGRGIAPTHEQKVVVNVPELPVVPIIAQLPNIKAVNPRPIHFDLRGQPQVEARHYFGSISLVDIAACNCNYCFIL
jgi:hypothetical protein